MNFDPLVKNDIISRWKNQQSIRGIAKDLQLGREVVVRVIRQHIAQTQASDSSSTPAGFGPVKFTRKSNLDPFPDPLKQLLERYPNITELRAFEELRKLSYSGSYSTLRNYIKGQRTKPKVPVIRFETPPGAQAQMDWSTYTLDFTQEGRRRVELFSYILSYARRQYIQFTERQDSETTARQGLWASWRRRGHGPVRQHESRGGSLGRWATDLQSSLLVVRHALWLPALGSQCFCSASHRHSYHSARAGRA